MRVLGFVLVSFGLFGLFGMTSGAAWASPPSEQPEPVEQASDADLERELEGREARVAEVELDLSVWRGGEQAPGRKRIPRRRAEVDGRAHYRLEAPAEAGQALVLLDFAEILAEPPRTLDEIALATYVSGAHESSRTDLLAVVDGEGRPLAWARRGSRRDLVIELPAGLTSLTIEYRVAVPHRYWPLGCVWQRCSLAGAAAPLPSEPARGGIWLPPGGRVPTPVQWTILGARFASVPDGRFAQLSARYVTRFGGAPSRLASLGYDAVLLVNSVGARWTLGQAFPRRALDDEDGFAGIDGIFRFRGGVAERGLEVQQIGPTGFVTVAAAPKAFR